MTLEPSGNMWTTLDAMADRQGVTIERGDIVLVHTNKIMKLRMVDPRRDRRTRYPTVRLAERNIALNRSRP